MSSLANSPNHFLASLTGRDRNLILPHLDPIELPAKAIFYKSGETIGRIYFPHNGVVSLIVELANEQFVGIGVFGRNSVIGAGAVLYGSVAINQAVSQIAGSGVIAQADVLKRLVAQSPTLRIAFARHARMASAQAQQIAACNALHDMERRLSHWLLQTRDLLPNDTLSLTQELLAKTLGTKRSSVTLVAQKLQEAGLINYRRGRIHILDVKALEASSCECYAAINRHFQRLVGWKSSEQSRGPSPAEPLGGAADNAGRATCPISSSSAKGSNIIHLAGSLRRQEFTW